MPTDKHGVPTVTIGSGQYEIHTIKEYVDLTEFANGGGAGDAGRVAESTMEERCVRRL